MEIHPSLLILPSTLKLYNLENRDARQTLHSLYIYADSDDTNIDNKFKKNSKKIHILPKSSNLGAYEARNVNF